MNGGISKGGPSLTKGCQLNTNNMKIPTTDSNIKKQITTYSNKVVYKENLFVKC